MARRVATHELADFDFTSEGEESSVHEGRILFSTQRPNEHFPAFVRRAIVGSWLYALYVVEIPMFTASPRSILYTGAVLL